MSRTVHVSFEVRNVTILKKTIEECGMDCNEQGNIVSARGRGYRQIEFDVTKNRIAFDEMDKHTVNQIKQTYMINWYKDQAIKEGMQLREERQTNGTVVLTLVR